MSKTRAIEALEKVGAPFHVHYYHVDAVTRSYGESVADAMGVGGGRIFKTLVATIDGRHAIGIVPVDRQLSLKSLAKAASGKRAHMAEAKDAERLTGYVVGGISPFGRARSLPVFVDESAFNHATVFVSGGRRGIQLEVEPDLLIELTSGVRAEIAD
ncbi:MAG: Cys-tRNA(Pro) deacylase [Acidimicrobiia bacterium]|nr:Cys-tRNA(Pro) deacylase [Acidimicrobiia bacterium]